jgi:preprotein translocase subunit SecA
MQHQEKVKTLAFKKVIRPFKKTRALFDKATGNPVETDLGVYREIVSAVKLRDFRGLPDGELRFMSEALIMKARSAPDIAEYGAVSVPLALPDRLIEAFALVLEASRRILRLEPFDAQLIAGLAMAGEKIAELPTGEGKTLAAVFPAYFYALSGKGVHVLTFNDYLARRDAAWMGPIYEFLGLAVGCAREGAQAGDKRYAYACDVTYATAKEAGFDFLRDGITLSASDLVHRPFHMALVDEADSILIDEARVPLIIAGVGERATWDARRLAGLIKASAPGRDYETDAEHRNVFLTDEGAARLEAALGCSSLYDAKNQRLLEAVHCALHAEALLTRDVDYIVRDSRIEIVDEFTGRVVGNRHWPDGLQAAVEAKEGLARKTEGRVLGSMTLQHFFRLYPHLSGMTATARPAAREFKEFYGLNTVVVPPNRPSVRVDKPDRIFTHRDAKRTAIVAEIARAHSRGRPVLVGTASVRESEELATNLKAAGIVCEVLNAKNNELEARIIAGAGKPGAVTISTNMAGRGTDIKLGGEDERERGRVMALGGLYVIGTNRHESLRIDHQLRGRSGRQGDPGSTRFFISLEDDLFERYGLTGSLFKRHRLSRQPEAVENALVSRDIGHAQRVIEGQNFDIRRSLWKYSELVETQRRIIQDWRCSVLTQDVDLETSSGPVAEKAPALFAAAAARFGEREARELERRMTLVQIDDAWSDHLAWVQDTRESIHLVSLGGKTPLGEFQRSATAEFLKIWPRVETAVIATFTSMLGKEGPLDFDSDGLKGPSSTWTYLVNEDQFGWGIEILSGKNIGLAAGAALYAGPLYVFALLINKFSKKKARKAT